MCAIGTLEIHFFPYTACLMQKKITFPNLLHKSTQSGDIRYIISFNNIEINSNSTFSKVPLSRLFVFAYFSSKLKTLKSFSRD
jgi:hypothetical protein